MTRKPSHSFRVHPISDKVDEAQRRLIQELEDELQTAHDLQRIMQEAKTFRGEVAQGDDQTVVVLNLNAPPP